MPETAEVSNNLPEEQDKNSEKYLIFSIMDKLYSFPSRIIGEIVLFDAVYPLPLMPSFILGVVNRYSIPYALFDIGLLFYNTPSPRKKVLVVKEIIDRISFLIDDVSGIADLQLDELYNIEKSTDSTDLSDMISASFYWNNNNVFVLDIHKILRRITEAIA
jgi:purine-binding chemotaxis protein CheW